MTEPGQTANKSAVEGLAAENGSDPAPDDPAGDDPADNDPAGDDPAGDDSAGDDSAGDDPAGPASPSSPVAEPEGSGPPAVTEPGKDDIPAGPGVAAREGADAEPPGDSRPQPALAAGSPAPAEQGPAGRFFARVDQAAGGYPVDLVLYALSTVFALVTALSSTLAPHRAWGAIAVWAYAVAFLLAAVQLAGHRLTHRAATPGRFARTLFGNGGRAALTWLTWGAASLLPLAVQAMQRADGWTDRAQEEVLVVERMGERLLHDGTPYLSREAIAALPADERLMGYSPYQPGMSLFGLPRAIAGDAWWTDARIWFALFTALTLIAAVLILRPGTTVVLNSLNARLHRPVCGFRPARLSRRPAASKVEPTAPDPPPTPAAEISNSSGNESRRWQSFASVRALQTVTVLPIVALTLATGGDDIPVLALCLLALAFAATDRYGWAGVAVGAAAACKLFALPVVAVLAVLALATGRGGRFLPGALGLPLLVLVPPFQVDQDAFVENVVRFPTGHGLVTSPAQSPFPGYLIAENVPDGRLIALGLLLAVAAVITVRIIWSPPRTAASASLISGWGLLGAILLMPTTRFGYLLYPVAFLVWAGVLAAAHRNHTATSGPSDDTALYRR